MQRLAEQIATALVRAGPTVLVRWGWPQAGLPLFMIWAAVRVWWGALRRDIRVLYLGDPVLAVLGSLGRRKGIPVVVTVHGLDIWHSQRAYQAYLRRFFWHRFDGYLCHSQFVAETLRSRGIPQAKIRLLPLGVDVESPPFRSGAPRTGVRLLALGRFVRRKGFGWFLADVAARLIARHPSAKIVLAGTGPERVRIMKIITANRLENNVEVHCDVDESLKRTLLDQCDAVIMPNIRVTNDVEGFGIVALEAGAAGKVVFASDLEGLKDAVHEGQNGYRLPPGDAEVWLETLDAALADPASLVAAGLRAFEHVSRHHNWIQIGRNYANTINEFARP